MKVIHTLVEMRAWRRQTTGSVGFVPTMGYLHEGHLSLVRRAREENSLVVVSIFVNPLQFGPGEDYAVYPRKPEQDMDLLQKEKTDIVFAPSAEAMYPPGFNSWVNVKGVTERLEGICRPGHFKGVATVVNKLFNLVEPKRAYFGQKDAQQAIVIRKMVTDLNLNLDVVVLPTVRENDGLAMSSRNTHLKPEEREAATILFKALTAVQKLYDGGERDAESLRRELLSLVGTEPLAKIDYGSIADRETLEELSVVDRPALVSLAVKIGKVRLIDNILLE
jgi:pantoate--beta-alanine ligase